MIIGVATIPFLLEKIGVERLGVLTLVWALIGYFSIFDFGLGRALTHQVSTLRAQEKHNQIYATVKNGLILMFGFGLSGAALAAIALYVAGLHWLNLSAGIYSETYSALMVAVLGVPVTTLTSGFKGILEGFEEFRAVNILRSFLGIANFALPVAIVQFYGPSLIGIVIGLVIARFIVFLMHIILTNKSISLTYIISSRESENSKELFTFGAWMTLSNIVSPLMVVADRFVISHFLSATTVAFYTIPFDFLLRLLILPAALTTALFPRIAFNYTVNRVEAKHLFHKSIKLIAIVMLPICLLIAVISYRGLEFWLGHNFAESSYLVTSIIAIGIFFNSLAQVPLMLIQAAGDVRKTSIIHVVEFLIYAPILVFAVSNFGLLGAASTWLLRAMIDFLVLYTFAMRKLDY